MLFHKNRQTASRGGTVHRGGVSTGSRSLSHDIATVEQTRFGFRLYPGAGHSR
jgi:hypothetical protein